MMPEACFMIESKRGGDGFSVFALCLSDPSVFELCLMKPSVFYYLIVGQFRWQAGGALQYDLTVANSTAFAHITCNSPPLSHLFSLLYMQTRHV